MPAGYDPNNDPGRHPAKAPPPPSAGTGQPSLAGERRARSRTRGRRSATPTGNTRSSSGDNVDTQSSNTTQSSTTSKTSRGVSPMVMKGLRKIRNITSSRSQSPKKAAASRQEGRSKASDPGASTTDKKRFRSSSARRAPGGGGAGKQSPAEATTNTPTPGRRPVLARLSDEEYVKPIPRVPRPRKGQPFFPAGPPTGKSGIKTDDKRNSTSNIDVKAPLPSSPPSPSKSPKRMMVKPVSGSNFAQLSPTDTHTYKKHPSSNKLHHSQRRSNVGGGIGGGDGGGGNGRSAFDPPKKAPSPPNVEGDGDDDEEKRELESPVKQRQQPQQKQQQRRTGDGKEQSGLDLPKKAPTPSFEVGRDGDKDEEKRESERSIKQQRQQSHHRQQQQLRRNDGRSGGGRGGKSRSAADTLKKVPSSPEMIGLGDKHKPRKETETPVRQHQRGHKHKPQRSKSDFDSTNPIPSVPSPPETGSDGNKDDEKIDPENPVKQRQRSHKHKPERSKSAFDSAKPIPAWPVDKAMDDEPEGEGNSGVLEEPVLQPSQVSSHQRTLRNDHRRKKTPKDQPKTQKPHSMPEVTSASRSLSIVSGLTDASSVHSNPTDMFQKQKNKDEEDDIEEEEEPPTPIERSNLDKKSLDSMKEIKDAIKQMRHERRKVKFGDIKENPLLDSSGSLSNAQTSNPQLQTQKDLSVTTRTRLEGITVNDLEVGFMKQSSSPSLNPASIKVPVASATSPPTPIASIFVNEEHVATNQPHHEDVQSSENPTVEREIKVASLQKQVKKVKKSIKRTCRDVWTEREDIIQLQRKNWSLRKTLVNSEAPRDSVTTLNMKIEKLLRQERELDVELDRCEEEKEYLEEDCSRLAKSISEFKDLLDELNKKVVPLLQPLGEEIVEEEDEDEDDDEVEGNHTDVKGGDPSEELGDDSIHSVEDGNVHTINDIVIS